MSQSLCVLPFKLDPTPRYGLVVGEVQILSMMDVLLFEMFSGFHSSLQSIYLYMLFDDASTEARRVFDSGP